MRTIHPHHTHRTRTLGGWILALAVVPWVVHARELPQMDALASAPVIARAKVSVALPEGVDRWSREDRLGIPSFVWLKPASTLLAKSAPSDATTVARAVLQQLAPAYGMTRAEVAAAPVHHYQNMEGGAKLVRFTNAKDGIEVFREQATVLLNAQSQAVSVGGYLGSTAQAATTKSAGKTIQAVDAIALALADFDFAASVASELQDKPNESGESRGAYQWYVLPPAVQGADGAVLEYARSKPVWFRLPQGLVLAHYVEVRVREGTEVHGYGYVFGAKDGQMLLRNNQTAHANDFSYRVWTDPTTKVPMPGPQGRNGMPHPTGVPDDYAPPLTSAPLVRLANAPFSKNDPWLAAGATRTKGNNVHAYADLNGPDGYTANSNECTMLAPVVGDQQACAIDTVFDSVYDFSLGAQTNKTQVAASVVNLFYTTNWLHDWFYDAGFDEAAGNAQADNYSRGGAGGDAMRAEALDSSGTNNANMYTPADGAAPRMQMYRYVNQAPAMLTVSAPAALVGTVQAGAASFGPLTYSVSGDVVQAQSAGALPNEACSALNTASAVSGKIALVDRGTCAFTIKVKNAQSAGAIAVVIVDNALGAVTGMTGTDSTVTIPSVRISQSAGLEWRQRLDAGEAIVVDLKKNLDVDVQRSSALDGTIVAHEWGHFISNRLIGDSNGLIVNHARGLGEGWGDFHALLMTVTETDKAVAGNGQYQGTYAMAVHSLGAVNGPDIDPGNVAYFGTRRYPYSTDMSKNPLSFKHIQNGVGLPAGIPVNANTSENAEVHNTGEVWAGMLWQCYASLLNRHPFAEAQTRMKNALVAGYKLTPVNPTLIEARDALLAVMAVKDPQDHLSCLEGFARRGAGANAQAMTDRYSSTNIGVTEDFQSGGALVLDDMVLSMTAPGAQRCDADQILDATETGVLQLTVRNRGGAMVSGAQLQLSASTPELQFVDGAMVLVPDVPAGEARDVLIRVTATGTAVPQRASVTAVMTYTGQVQAAQKALVVSLHQDQHDGRVLSDGADAAQTAMRFGSTLALAADRWAVAGTLLDPLYEGVPPETVASTWMETPDVQVSSGQSFTLSFKHRHLFERDTNNNYYDGGQLMISEDAGQTWATVPETQAQYNGRLYFGVDGNVSGNPKKGEMAYVGQSASWPKLQTETIDFGTAYAGKTIRIRWVMQTDQLVTDDGWQVDDIVFSGIDNTPFPEMVADAQMCATLQTDGGAGQATVVGTAFAQPLRVKILDAAGAALEGAEVVFAAPTSGAAAVFAGGVAQVAVLTDAAGVAQSPALTANATAGSYTVVATRGTQTLGFALTNTTTPGGGTDGGGTPAVLRFSGPSPQGQGIVTATVQSAQTALPTSARFASGAIVAASTVPELDGYRFPFGLADFVLQDVGVGNTVTLRMQYPAAVPADAQYWKYGRTTAGGALHWYTIPMTVVDAYTVEITLTDGGTGDSDVMADGAITDPGGVAVPVAAMVPTGGAVPVPGLSAAALAMLALLMAGMGWQRRRRRC